MYNIHFIKQALLDIEDVVLWYEKQRKGLSYDFELCLEVGLNQITRNPSSFQKRYKSVKILFINRFPYGIHYTTGKDTIAVIGIFHTSRSPKNWEFRLNSKR